MKTRNVLFNLNLIDEFSQKSTQFKQSYLSRLNAIQEVIIDDIKEWLNRDINNAPYDLDFVLSDLCLNLEIWHLPNSINFPDEDDEITNWTMQEVWSWGNEDNRSFLASEYLPESINFSIRNHHLKLDASNIEIDKWLNDSIVTLVKILNIFSNTENILNIKSAHIALNIILTRMLVEIYTLKQFRNF